jgi:hypothetical protein
MRTLHVVGEGAPEIAKAPGGNRGGVGRVRSARVLAKVALVVLLTAVAVGSGRPAHAASDRHRPAVAFVDRVDGGLPPAAVLRFARTAQHAGLTPAQTLRILNDDRFRAALGFAGQGTGLLEALSEDPGAIRRTLELVRRHDLTEAGSNSLQNSIISIDLDIRNGYLRDLGRLAVETPTGALVMVDLQTGRQIIGHDGLGALLTAPGGGPLPSSAPTIVPSPTPEPSFFPEPPGSGLNTARPNQSDPGVWRAATLFSAIFALAWVGYAMLAVFRRPNRGA